MTIKDLKATNPEYNADEMERIAAYNAGGTLFPANKELRNKTIELSGNSIGGDVRKVRVQCADYTNYYGDTILDLACNVCACPLEIESEDPYYDGLNTNSDGKNSGANEQTRAAVMDDLLYNRSFYLLKYPNVAAKMRSDQAANKGLDARISSIACALVTDWEEDPETGKLKWAKTAEKFPTRSSTFGPSDVVVNRWTFFTPDDVQIYTAPETAKDEEDVTPEIIPHTVGVCPIFKTNRKLKCWVGDKLLPTAYMLFNAEADATYYKFSTITGALYIFAENKSAYQTGVILSPLNAIVCDQGDRIDRDRADPATMNALDQSCAALRAQLGGMIHTMARQTASQSSSGQNTSRASGSAMEMASDPLKVFLQAFAEPQCAVWRSMLEVVAKAREDEPGVYDVCGLIEYDETADDPITTDRVNAEAGFERLVYVPDEAKKARGITVGLEANPDADPETVEKIKKGVTKPVVQTPDETTKQDE